MPIGQGRRAVRVAATAVLLFLCVGSTARADVRPAADIGLLELYPGAVTYHANEQLRVGAIPLLEARAARVELGAEVTDNLGITTGASLAEVFGLYQFSLLPVSGRIYWDFTPNELWRRGTAYVTASYHHTNYYPDEPTPAPFVLLGAGATYTYYAVTARAELFTGVSRPSGVGLLLGLQVGGPYIIGRHGPTR